MADRRARTNEELAARKAAQKDAKTSKAGDGSSSSNTEDRGSSSRLDQLRRQHSFLPGENQRAHETTKEQVERLVRESIRFRQERASHMHDQDFTQQWKESYVTRELQKRGIDAKYYFSLIENK
jgi:hypothetical protein